MKILKVFFLVLLLSSSTQEIFAKGKKVDSMLQYSQPLRVEQTKLAEVFYMQARKKAEKPDRTLSVAYDKRFPLVDGFKAKYIYWVHFEKKGANAGNHFHKKKAELFYPVAGEFIVYLEDPKTGEKETIPLKFENAQFPVIHVKTGIAHRVHTKKADSTLLVVASSSASDGDEFAYVVK